jgi:uncharacterized protein DUF4383
LIPRTLALVLGLAYVGLGALGLMPGALAGLLPGNAALAVVHLAMGAWGVASYLGRASPRTYARSAAVVFAVLALAGMLSGIERLPVGVHGASVWLHLLTAAAAGFVAWRPRTGERRSIAGDRRRSRREAPSIERRHGTAERRKEPAAA